MSVDRMGFMAVSLARLTALWHLSKDAGMKRALAGEHPRRRCRGDVDRPVGCARDAPCRRRIPRGQAAFDRSTYAIPHKKFVLDNGLTLIVHEDHSVPVVAVNLWYHVGSRNEQRGKTGFAHLFEHFFFNGSRALPAGLPRGDGRPRRQQPQRHHQRRIAPTSSRTCRCRRSSARCTSKPTAWASWPTQINEAMLERERGVVQNEKRQGENQPYGRVFDAGRRDASIRRASLQLADHRQHGGPQRRQLDDVQGRGTASYYGPNNCVLSLAGDITPERALALVKKYFDGIPPGPPLDRADAVGAAARRATSATRCRTACRRRASTASTTRPPGATPDCATLELRRRACSADRAARASTAALVYEKDARHRRRRAASTRSELAQPVRASWPRCKPGVDPARRRAARWTRVVGEFVAAGADRRRSCSARAAATLADFVARHRAARRLRRPLRHPRREPDLRRHAPTAYLDRLERMATATAGEVATARRSAGSTRRTTR